MLQSTRRASAKAGSARFAIIASRYNARYVDSMLRAAKATLKKAGANNVQVVRVPGAYEIPLAAAWLAGKHQEMTSKAGFESTLLSGNSKGGKRKVKNAPARGFSIICLGVILRGETVHAAHIGEAVSRALMNIQLRYEVPVIHEVLLLENEAQARARCLNPRHNRGTEAAQTALAMARVMSELS